MQRTLVSRRLAITVAFAAVLLFAAATQSSRAAQLGPYVAGAVGIGFPADSDLDTATTSENTELDPGFAAMFAVGHLYGNGFGTEIELGYRGNDVDRISGATATGDIGIFSIMLNGYYDFGVSRRGTPYIGAGVGVARLDAGGISPVSNSRVDDQATALAYQATAGIAYPVNDQLEIMLSYRYFAIPDAGLDTDAGASVDSDYTSHAVRFGFRYRFGRLREVLGTVPPVTAPPYTAPAASPLQPSVKSTARSAAAAAPAAKPAPSAENYLVFFDWNRWNLTPDARRIVKTAADGARRTGATRIEVTGHADRSGAQGYNLKLSERRAITVRAALVKGGVAPDKITTSARGETDPLVPTADGVREPQNRRAQIFLRIQKTSEAPVLRPPGR
jgi:outer membrane protein OmpA-like peptidoglycan-associated protein